MCVTRDGAQNSMPKIDEVLKFINLNENKYHSTNIKMKIFREHIEIIRKSNFDFHNPNNFEEQFNIPKSKKEILFLL